MGGKSTKVILPLVALGIAGVATGGFGLLGAGAAGAGAGAAGAAGAGAAGAGAAGTSAALTKTAGAAVANQMGAGSLTGIAAQKFAAVPTALNLGATGGSSIGIGNVLSGASLGLNVFNQVAGAQSQRAAQNLQAQQLETQRLHEELAFEERQSQTQKELQKGLASLSNSDVDGSARTSLAEAMNTTANTQLGSLTAQNALSMQRNGNAMTQSRIEKSATGRKLFTGLLETGLEEAEKVT